MSGPDASPFAIEVDGVGKRFTKYEDTPMLISRLIQLRNRTRRSTLWALRGASFHVGKGECLGVIGRNGSGKSTLLQMLAGVTAPTEGRVTIHGRVAPLISVGVGFHPELTGRENVYVNATILGLSRAEIDERFDEIVAFSEIGEFINTPVKFYSSGMFVRLGFAVSVLSKPDVLLVDEVLAVGDMGFQMKCFERMEALRSSGATVVLVTHNLNAVRRLCDRTLVIHNGQLRHDGDTVEAMSVYHELLGKPLTVDDVVPSDGALMLHGADIEDMELCGPDEQPLRHADAGSRLTVSATVRFREPVDAPVMTLRVLSESGVQVYAERFPLSRPEGFHAGDRVSARASFAVDLPMGSYSAGVTLSSLQSPLLAPHRPAILFFVTGRPRVRGIADLHGHLDMVAHAAGRSVDENEAS